MTDRSDLSDVAASLSLPPSGSPFASDALHGLPAAVRRYLTASIAEGTPPYRAARFAMRGEIRLGSRWIRFTGQELLAPRDGFLWTARTRIGISGSDHYVAGAGAMSWKLLGLVPVLRAQGPDVSRSARGRATGEAAWLPTALLPAAGASWEDATDDAHLTARVVTDGHETALDLVVGGDGRLRSVGFDRWGDPDDAGTFAVHRFGMDVAEYGTFGGLTIPVAGLAGWHHGSDRWPGSAFFRYRITDVAPILAPAD